jgi:glycosyltransferase involved in cell wall biosynthesis
MRVESTVRMENQPISICLIGGIYGKGKEYRSTVTSTPETVLESGLKARNHRVFGFGHRASVNLRDIDIVHVHHLGLGAIKIASGTSTLPFVYTSHDGPAMAGLSNGVSQSLARQFVLSRADAVVALTNTEAEFQQKMYDLRGAAHVVIPNGVDTKVFRYGRKNRAGNGGPWELLYVGQLIREKQVGVLLHAMAILPPHIQLTLVFQTDSLLKSLKQLSKNLGIEQRVRFAGAKRSKELNDIYQSSDVLVLPSSAESLPSVVSEALVCGTPVVATDVGGIRDQISGFGRLVAPGDPNALAKAIRSVLESYATFAARGESMSRYAINRFSIETMVDQHVHLYRSLLEKKSAPRRTHLSQRPLNITAHLAASLLCKTS